MPADFDTLCEIDKACYEPAIAYSKREMRAYMKYPGAECIVAETDAVNPHSAGFCLTALHAGVGYVITIDVLTEFRRQGVGHMLIAEAEERLAVRGARMVALETATDNVSAIAFWRKHGYRERGIHKNYYPNGRDAYAMTKTLSR